MGQVTVAEVAACVGCKALGAGSGSETCGTCLGHSATTPETSPPAPGVTPWAMMVPSCGLGDAPRHVDVTAVVARKQHASARPVDGHRLAVRSAEPTHAPQHLTGDHVDHRRVVARLIGDVSRVGIGAGDHIPDVMAGPE